MRQSLRKPLPNLNTTPLSGTRPRPGLKWQAGAEFVRSRIVYKSLDAALTAPLRPRLNRRHYLETIFNWNSSNYERVAASTNLLDTFFSGFAGGLSARLINSSGFPLAGSEVALMSYGSGSTVFLLKRPDKEWVLKIYRRSLGKKGQSLAHIANHFKTKYETVCSWYNGRVNLVPPAYFLILHGPLLSSPSAAVLQTYIQGHKTDFFLDHPNHELLRLMQNDQAFAEQFLFMVEQTLDVYAKQDLCVDFLGRENLMLVEKDGRHQLLVVDNGIFHMTTLQRDAPAVYGRIKARLERLQYLRRELE